MQILTLQGSYTNLKRKENLTMSEALNQTLGSNTEQVQGNSEVDTQSSEYLEARQAFFDNMDKPENIVEEQVQQQEEKGEQEDGLQKEEVFDNQTQEVVEEQQQPQESEESEEPSDESTQTEDKPKTRQKRQYKVKADGQDFDFTIDELKLMASKGVNYTQKLQKLSPFRKMISAIEDNGITESEINQFIEMRKGNKDAIGAFTKKYNIALSDIEEGEKAESYTPQEYGREQTPLNDIDEELSLSMDEGNYKKMCNFFNKELDKDSVQFFVDNPEALRELSKDIEGGVFETIRKEIHRGDLLNKYKAGVPYIQKYIYEAHQFQEAQKAKTTTLGNQQEQKPQVDKTQLGISGTKNIADNTKKIANSIDELDDDEYIAWKKKLMI